MANKQSSSSKASIKVQDLKTKKDAKGGLLTKTDPYNKDAYYADKYGTTTTTTTKSTETVPTDPKLVP
jgi:hypothetical protein